MGQKDSNPFSQNKQTMRDYQFLQRDFEHSITFLREKSTNKDYLLREHTFNELRQFRINLQKLQNRRKLKHTHLTNLQSVQDRAQDQMCSSFFKIYALWQDPKKSLLDEIAKRILQNKPFSQQELWKMLENCIQVLAHLQSNNISHQCLTSKSILFEENGNIKLADPLRYGQTTNHEYVLINRHNKCVYLSPEQCESIKNKMPIIQKNAYKNDVFILGMIILEAGLLQKQDKCYSEDRSMIEEQNLMKNILRFGQKYGYQLRKMVEIMTVRNIHNRSEWKDLQNLIRLIKGGNNTQSSNTKDMKILSQPQITTTQQQIYIPSHTNSPFYGNVLQKGLPLPTIISVSNDGESLIKNPSHLNNNISSIPHYGSPVGIASHQTKISQNSYNQKSIQTKSSQHPKYEHGFLPVDSKIPQSPSQAYNIRTIYPSQMSPNRSIYQTQDMIATFGNSLNNNTTYHHQNDIRRNVSIGKKNQGAVVYTMSNQGINISSLHRSKEIKGKNKGNDNDEMKQIKYVEQKFTKGSRYEGYKVNGVRHGQGKFYYQDGGRYEGEWQKNKMNGFGRLFYQSDKIAYEGQWLDDQFHGRGRLYNEKPQIMAQGFDYRNFDEIQEKWQYYEGQFTEDLKNGRGKLKFSNGQYFEGTFIDDMVQGEGNFVCKNGKIVHGFWVENQLIKLINNNL